MAGERIDAVVFDFDGVLVRSIELHAVAYQLVLKPFGVRVDPRQVFVREGARSETIIRELMTEAGLAPRDGLVERLSLLKQRAFEAIGQPRVHPDAADVVEEVAGRGFPIAIATGTRRENVPAIAGSFADRFSFLATQETYQRDKPHPEPFETAARGLGVAPERCIAIENAPRGIASARDAGMYVVAITSTLPARELDGAHAVVGSLVEVLGFMPERPGEPVAEPVG